MAEIVDFKKDQNWSLLLKHVDQVSDGSGEVGAARITSEVLEVMIKVIVLQDHNDEDDGHHDENDDDDEDEDDNNGNDVESDDHDQL